MTAKFVDIHVTYTIVITSEGLDENYTYTFELAKGATIENELFEREGFTYKIFVGDTAIRDILVTGAENYVVVYTEISDIPEPPTSEEPEPPTSEEPEPPTSEEPEPPTSEEPEPPTSENDSKNSEKDSSSNKKGGCFGVVPIGGIGLATLFGAMIMVFKKRKED